MIQKYPPNWLLPSVPDTGPHSGIFLYYVFSTCQRCVISLDGGVSICPESVQRKLTSQGRNFAVDGPVTSSSPPRSPQPVVTRSPRGTSRPRRRAVSLHVRSTCFLFWPLYRHHVLISFLPTSFITVVGICLVEKTKSSPVKDKVSFQCVERRTDMKKGGEEWHNVDDNGAS